MKEKLIAFVLAGLMVLSLVGCGAQKDKDNAANGGNSDVTDNNGGTTNNGTTNNGTTNNGTTDNGNTNNNGDGSVAGNAKGRTWDTDVRSGNSNAYDYDFDNNGGSTFGGIDQDNTVYDGMGGYRTDRTATWAQMLENGRVHDSDGFLLDGENSTW